jgi:ElaB/YqjD/DUF883 family membrane-anchored ribosome-binding protein
MATAAANEELVNDLKVLVRNAEALMEASAGRGGERLAELRARLTAALESAKGTCADLEDKTEETTSAVDRCIRSHPYETIGVAFGLGLLLGVLFGRK